LCLWRNLKGKVYEKKPHTTETLQNEMTYVIASVTEAELQKASED
jgi:hypothetical protein